MSSRIRIPVITVIAFAILVMSVAAYLFFRQPVVSSRSLLLYTNYQSPETITNWIIDTDTNEKWEVGKGLAAWHWSPSGKYLVFYTLSPLPRQIWISDSDGSNLRKVLDNQDHPELEIKDFEWLSDETIIVNVVSKAENSGFVYALNVNTLSFNRFRNGNFASLSPTRGLWIQWAEQHYEIADLSGRTAYISDNLSEYYFSPNGEKMAYFCAGEGKYSSLCFADISINGIKNEYKFVDMRTNLYAFGEMKWSPDGTYFSFLCSPDKTETRFCAIDVSDGLVTYEYTYPSKTIRIFWSPRREKIIDRDGLLLDLKTGQVSNFFAEIGETIPSYVVDWRMIEMP